MSEMYGSLTNRLAENCLGKEPEIGMGVTEFLWSDSHAYEIIEVRDEKHITIRSLKYKCKPGTDCFDNDYDYFSDENGRVRELYKAKYGWRERIGKRSLGDTKYLVGYAREYRDPSF